MFLEVFAICDAATDSQGKLNILGAFDTIFARKLPSVHPQLAIVARLRISNLDAGEHKVTIDIVDDAGTLIVPKLEGGLSVTVNEEESAIANIIFNIQSFKINKFGPYKIILYIDGNAVASLPLFIKELPQLHG